MLRAASAAQEAPRGGQHADLAEGLREAAGHAAQPLDTPGGYAPAGSGHSGGDRAGGGENRVERRRSAPRGTPHFRRGPFGPHAGPRRRATAHRRGPGDPAAPGGGRRRAALPARQCPARARGNDAVDERPGRAAVRHRRPVGQRRSGRSQEGHGPGRHGRGRAHRDLPYFRQHGRVEGFAASPRPDRLLSVPRRRRLREPGHHRAATSAASLAAGPNSSCFSPSATMPATRSTPCRWKSRSTAAAC